MDTIINKRKAISIIIPCYNCSGTVMKTWASLKDQTLGIDNVECIFVDDASTDDGRTWESLRAIKNENPGSVIIIHLEENLRQGGARNVGLSHATGEYILFVDSDDEIELKACKVLYDHARECQADIVQFNHWYRFGDQTRKTSWSASEEVFSINNSEDRYKFLNATIVTYGCNNKLYSHEIIKMAEARFAEHAVYEEPLFVYPCFLYARRVSLIKDALYIYSIHEGSTITATIGIRLLDHPRVQLELLEYCISRPELYTVYKDVIGLYFLWSYYCETLCFAGEHSGAYLPLEYYKGMQKVCRKLFPNWRDNPLIKTVSENVYTTLESIDGEVNDQNELNQLILEISNMLK